MSSTAAWILTGGKASRLGYCNKGLLKLEGSRCIDRVLSAISPICDDINFVGSENQFDDINIPVVEDSLQIGPLGGIAEALRRSAAKWNIILSMDLPFISVDLIKFLLLQAQNNNFQWFIPKMNEKEHMLCSVIDKSALGILENQIIKNDYKVRNLIPLLGSKIIEISSDLPFYSEKLLFNLNSFEDLKEIQ